MLSYTLFLKREQFNERERERENMITDSCGDSLNEDRGICTDLDEVGSCSIINPHDQDDMVDLDSGYVIYHWFCKLRGWEDEMMRY